MIVTEINLRELVEQYKIAPDSSIDQFSVTLHLGKTVCSYKFPDGEIVTYGEGISKENVRTEEISSEYILRPGKSVLACSTEHVNIPKGYMGFIQTKGSLARLFVTVQCCDGQIEPGFSGHITFEVCNMGCLNVRLLPESAVAQLFLFKCSADKYAYQGQYKESEVPTYSNSKK